MSLRERLMGGGGGKGPISPVVPPKEATENGGEPGRSVTATLASRIPANASGMYQRKQDEVALTAVDQLKVELHWRLIERLDLEALEQIKDEVELTTQIRQAVVEFLRNEPTPLSQAEREEIVEQIIYEITGLGPIEPLPRSVDQRYPRQRCEGHLHRAAGAALARAHRVPQRFTPAIGDRPDRDARRTAYR